MSEPTVPDRPQPEMTPFDHAADEWPTAPPGCRWFMRPDGLDATQLGLAWRDQGGAEQFTPVCPLPILGRRTSVDDPTPPGCRVPAGWPCLLFPLGRDRHWVEAWLGYAISMVSDEISTEHLPEGVDNPSYGCRTLVRASRSLAAAERVLPVGREAVDLPRTKADAKAALLLFRDCLMASRPHRGASLAADYPKLGSEHQKILLTLYRGQRFSVADVMSCSQLVKETYGPRTEPDKYRAIPRQLVQMKLARSIRNRGGGYCLTPEGVEVARRIAPEL